MIFTTLAQMNQTESAQAQAFLQYHLTKHNAACPLCRHAGLRLHALTTPTTHGEVAAATVICGQCSNQLTLVWGAIFQAGRGAVAQGQLKIAT